MKRLCGLAILLATASSFGSVISVSSGYSVLGNRPNNLLTNGSFEFDRSFYSEPFRFWATGTTNTPFVPLTGWAATGKPSSYAMWGHGSPGEIAGSAPIPHGTEALYFGALYMSSLGTQPTYHANGLVTFSGTPGIVPDPLYGPVTLSQTLTGLSTSQQYRLDFWASAEDAAFNVGWLDGFFGLDITGESTIYLTCPTFGSSLGPWLRYYVVFQPTASSVTLTWTNWGHYYDPNGLFHSELVMDDAIVNPVPEPGALAVLSLGLFGMLRSRR
ncbi:MAG: PEP-CTERM sorting domain-containing protein [Armatimonadetes bacterium]|nr:PEP-CTERM sorting domain-containing protein [Armatimonadota bacterium]